MGPSKKAFTFQIRPIFHFLFWKSICVGIENCHPFIWQGANEQSAEQPGQVTFEVDSGAGRLQICWTRLPVQMMDLIFFGD